MSALILERAEETTEGWKVRIKLKAVVADASG